MRHKYPYFNQFYPPSLPSQKTNFPVTITWNYCLFTEMASTRSAEHFVKVLLQVCEKSATIARAWRFQEELFELLVEEKTGKEKNKRFTRDFKTLADVLVQEVVKHDVIREVSSTHNFPLSDVLVTILIPKTKAESSEILLKEI